VSNDVGPLIKEDYLGLARACLDEALERLKDKYVEPSVLRVVREYAPEDVLDLECRASAGSPRRT